jgi:photosystem II stability/assembly factor-like uncharacterized protein
LPAILLLAFAAVVVPAQSEEPSPDPRQVADLEKQYQEAKQKADELKKKLDALRNGAATSVTAAPADALPADWVKAMNWRSIGPASMGGRIVAFSVFEADPSTYWVATASGGLLKTINNGVTFEHQFDREATVSVGDVCVAPSNREIVWVGTGENNPRNSVSYGDGVYKSTDGGKTWANMGLKKSFQVGKIVVHPKNPDIVYVGVLGRLYGPSEERGLYKTTDGGKTWQRVLFVDDKTGIIDIAMSPADPETLLVATWERQRDGFDSHPGNEPPIADGYDGYDPAKKWGPGSGIYRTVDGGKSFKKLAKGLPDCNLGRVGIDWYRKDPKVVYAIIDCEQIGMGPPPLWVGLGADNADGPATVLRVTAGGPGAKAGLKPGDLVTAIDKAPIKKWSEVGDAVLGHPPGEKVTFTVRRGYNWLFQHNKETTDIVVTLEERPDPNAPPPVYLGFQVEKTEAGLRVALVAKDGPADKAGLQADDVLLEINKKDVKEEAQIIEALRGHKAGDKLTLEVKRGTEKKDVVVTLAPRPGDKPQTGPRRPYSGMYSGQLENVQKAQGPDGWKYGGIYRSADGGETWTRINSLNPRPMYFSLLRVDPSDEKHLYVGGISLYRSSDGGKTFTGDGANGVHPDQHALWIDPKDGRHMLIGCDGGFYATYDRMDHWDFLNHMAIGQFYHVALDNRRPYHVYGGLQDNGSWGGPSHALHGGPINEDWVVVGGGDGFVCRVDPNEPDLVYSESQDGRIIRRNLHTNEAGLVRPQQEAGARPYRFNWNTPFILSSHNPSIVYVGGNYVFRSLKKGANLKAISPEITRTTRGSATALAESPRNPDVLWAGTDDGALWVTRDGGREWKNVSKNVGLPAPYWVATIEPSRGADGRAYVAFDAHRSDDDNPYIYVTEDFGQTWKSLRGNLPTGSTRVLREDVINTNLLYLGTEFAAYASTNRGATWTRLNNNLPTVAVHELAVHPVGAGRDGAAPDDGRGAESEGAAVPAGAGRLLDAGAGARLGLRHRQPPLRRAEPAFGGAAVLLADEEGGQGESEGPRLRRQNGGEHGEPEGGAGPAPDRVEPGARGRRRSVRRRRPRRGGDVPRGAGGGRRGAEPAAGGRGRPERAEDAHLRGGAGGEGRGGGAGARGDGKGGAGGARRAAGREAGEAGGLLIGASDPYRATLVCGGTMSRPCQNRAAARQGWPLIPAPGDGVRFACCRERPPWRSGECGTPRRAFPTDQTPSPGACIRNSPRTPSAELSHLPRDPLTSAGRTILLTDRSPPAEAK